VNVSGQTVMRELSYRNPVTLDELADSCDSAEGSTCFAAFCHRRAVRAANISATSGLNWMVRTRYAPARVRDRGNLRRCKRGDRSECSCAWVAGWPDIGRRCRPRHEAGVAAHADSVEVPVGDYLYTESIVLQFATYGYGNPDTPSCGHGCHWTISELQCAQASHAAGLERC